MDSLVTPLLCITLWYSMTKGRIYWQQEVGWRLLDRTPVKKLGVFLDPPSTVRESGTRFPGGRGGVK